MFGEESNKFTNTLGERVTVSVQDSQEQTARLLGTCAPRGKLTFHSSYCRGGALNEHTCCTLHKPLVLVCSAKVLDGNERAADLLAGAVHLSVVRDMDPRLKDSDVQVAVGDLGIWIDPIGEASFCYVKRLWRS